MNLPASRNQNTMGTHPPGPPGANVTLAAAAEPRKLIVLDGRPVKPGLDAKTDQKKKRETLVIVSESAGYRERLVFRFRLQGVRIVRVLSTLARRRLLCPFWKIRGWKFVIATLIRWLASPGGLQWCRCLHLACKEDLHA